MSEDAGQFLIRVVEDLTHAAKRYAYTRIESRTLREAMEVIIERKIRAVTGRVRIPHYWAIYYHAGRGPIRAKPGMKLVYFKNPEEDPRTQGGYPVRARDIRRLGTAEFYRYLKQGKIIAVESVGPAVGTYFFTRGMRTFTNGLRYRIRAAFEKWLLDSLRADKSLNVKDEAYVRLPR